VALLWILATIIAALFFYRLRSRCRWLYGLIELAVGVVILIATFYPAESGLLLAEQPYWGWGWLVSRSVGVLSGIYVIVRGLDNFDKGMPPHWARARCMWTRIFYGATVD
jgi:hypothetical protein